MSQAQYSFQKLMKFFMHRDLFFYLFVGGSAAVVNFGTFAIFYSLLHLHYEVAVSISYVLSVLVHFSGNRYLTFKSHSHALLPQLKRYGAMLAINYLITLFVVHVVVAWLRYSPYIGVICAIGATVGIGYVLAKCWVFKHKREQV